MDEGSQLRRSRNQEGLLPNDALRASFGNRRKNAAKAAGVSALRCDEGAIILGIKHFLRDERGRERPESSTVRSIAHLPEKHIVQRAGVFCNLFLYADV